ncbi:hypothetical protein O181_001566 [Austropuccinia psidii MF-1]|uniref:Uncharacterized protein n=1 Tax=Austropuccinia psidii MF-1 TaxID=1389203 RepID=A0A9Q3BAH3_9BASI|nr:hypothetical protein [Austropuccinia psidii MF-1]
MQGKDFPPDFKGFKVSEISFPHYHIVAHMPFLFWKDMSFKHIRMLWDVKENHSLPVPPTQTTLADLYQRVLNTNQIKAAIQDSCGVQINSEANVQFFSSEQLHPVQLGRGMKHLIQSYIDYIQGTLTRLLITKWSPNMPQNQDYL